MCRRARMVLGAILTATGSALTDDLPPRRVSTPEPSRDRTVANVPGPTVGDDAEAWTRNLVWHHGPDETCNYTNCYPCWLVGHDMEAD